MKPQLLQPYQYDSLPSHQSLRLLEIPFGLDETYRLQTFIVGQHPPYVALSYTWGSPLNTPESIAAYDGAESRITIKQLNGPAAFVTVGRNAHEAILRIRSLRLASYLWIDAVCINQADQTEVAMQIPLMSEIFSRCDSVLVWLGESDAHLDGLLDFNFDGFGGALLAYLKRTASNVLSEPDWSEADVKEKLGVTVNRDMIPAYKAFFTCRRWFNRSWVVQEVALAPAVEVLCAEKSFPFKDMLLVAYFVRFKLGLEISRLSNTAQLREMWQLGVVQLLCGKGGPMLDDSVVSSEVAEIVHAKSKREKCYALLQYLLEIVRSRETTQAHDNVYSVLGLFKYFFKSDVDPLLSPDYSLSPQEVFTRTAYLLVRELHSLSILSVAGVSPQRLTDIPSWVPDFTSHPVRSRFPVRDVQTTPSPSPQSRRPHMYRALNGNALHLDGTVLDTISAFADTGDFSRHAKLSTQIASILLIALPPTPTAPTEPVFHSLWHTMLADTDVFPAQSTATPDSFRAFLTVGLALALTDHPAGAPTPTPPPHFTSALTLLDELRAQGHADFPAASHVSAAARELDTDPDGPEASTLRGGFEAFRGRLFRGVYRNRRLFRTAGGRLGLGPADMRVGDMVWALEGATVLFVLREGAGGMETGMTLVGDVFLDGWDAVELRQTVEGKGARRIALV